MAAQHIVGAAAPGPVTPTRSDNAREQAGVEKEQAQAHGVSLCDSRAGSHGEQARRTIEGEAKASAYLARLHAEQADPDELAVIISMLYGATLRGFCRVIEKVLRGGAS